MLQVSLALLAAFASCSASPEPQSGCLAAIADLEHQRQAYIERTLPRLRALARTTEGEHTIESQRAFADFMTEIELLENRLKVARLRCPEAPPDIDRTVPVRIVKNLDSSPDP